MKHRTLIIIVIFIVALVAVPISTLAMPDRQISEVERRPLAQAMSYQEYLKSHYGAELADYFAYLETYLLDQFPFRDDLRVLTAMARVYGLRQRDNNMYYKVGEHLSKLDPVIRENAVQRALSLFNEVCRTYFSGQGKHVFALIPDKNAFMAESGGYPHVQYDSFLEMVSSELDAQTQILPLLEYLSLDDYYRTDPHWDQTKLLAVADALLQMLGVRNDAQDEGYETHVHSSYFGTFAGQAALPVKPDELAWLTNETLDQAIVYDAITKQTASIYQTDKLEGTDPYDLFLGGAQALLSVKNLKQLNGRQLVVFRDSYGSSMVPLLIADYSEIVVVDLRYVSMSVAAGLVDIHADADVLLLYSTSVLNSPGAFKQ